MTRSRWASSSRRASAASTWPSGEGQTLGNRLDFGGPSFGFFAATEAYLRRMPGRIAGETRDVDGRRGFVLTLQTREQHIRREKATSNICTAQALNALAGVVYLTWLGRRGLVELGELLLQRTHYARETLTALDGVEALHEQPVVREFAVRLDVGGCDSVSRVIARCQDAGVNPGFALGPRVRRAPRRPARRRHRAALQGGHRPPGRRPRRRGGRRAPDRGGRGMSATTETPLQREAATTIFEKGAPGRRAFSCPAMDVPEVEGLLPDGAAPHRPAAPARGLRARARAPLRQPLQAQLRPRLGLLPARLVHDEAQPAPARARRGDGRPRAPAPAAGPQRAPRAPWS